MSVCGCGKGRASDFDGLCKFCREKTVSRADAKRVGVRHRGDGMTVNQLLNVERSSWTGAAFKPALHC